VHVEDGEPRKFLQAVREALGLIQPPPIGRH